MKDKSSSVAESVLNFPKHTNAPHTANAVLQLRVSRPLSHHLSSLLRRAGLSQGEDVAADGDLPPDARFGVLGEAVSRVHHQHAVGGQPVHLTVRRLPLCSFLLTEQTH